MPSDQEFCWFMGRDINDELRKEVRRCNPSLERVRELVKQGANVNTRGDDDRSALMHAVSWPWASFEVAEYLIASGADVNAVIIDCGLSPLTEAARSGRLDLIELLIQSGVAIETGVHALLVAVDSRDPVTLPFLLHAGVNPNLMVSQMYAPLDIVDGTVRYYRECGTRIPENLAYLPKRYTDAARILREFGARHADQICAPCLGTWLHVSGRCPTGLFTNTGCLAVELLPNVSREFCARFEDWRNSFWKLWIRRKDYKRARKVDVPAWNINCGEGLALAKEVKQLVRTDVKVTHGKYSPNRVIKNDFGAVWFEF